MPELRLFKLSAAYSLEVRVAVVQSRSHVRAGVDDE